MASFDHADNVKTEKADAMRRYKRERILTLCLHSVLPFACLLWVFITFFPLLQRFSSLYLSFFNKPFFIFSLINALIVFLIYNFTNSQNDSVFYPNNNLYDQYVSFRKDKSVASPQEPEVVYSDKQIIHYENNAVVSENNAVVSENNAVVSENDDIKFNDVKNDNSLRDLTVVIETEKKPFKRTLSEKKKQSGGQRRVLRRSDTEVYGREMVVVGGNGGDQRKCLMDHMNNEEFRIAIDKFIASKKKFLRDENFDVILEEKKEDSSFTAITLTG